LFTIGSLSGNQEVWSIRVPDLLSLIATLNPHGTVGALHAGRDELVALIFTPIVLSWEQWQSVAPLPAGLSSGRSGTAGPTRACATYPGWRNSPDMAVPARA
jgi:hypothetical protein